MHTQIKRQIIKIASESPIETCGFIYKDIVDRPQIFPCKNIAENPEEHFEISEEDYIEALKLSSPHDPLAVYHSHPAPESKGFSDDDLEHASHINLPYYLYDVGGKAWLEFIPKDYKVEIGAPFSLGFNDCYGLVRNYFRQNFGHYLSDYDRDESFHHEEERTIMNRFEKEGFELGSLQTLSAHDVILFKSDKVLPQHFGIYIGKQRFIHHPQGSLSREELLNDRWLTRIVCILQRKT